MAYETLIYEKEGHIASVTLNRPHRLNAIDTQMRMDLCAVMDDIESDNDVWVVILSGNERAFSAGADLLEDNRAPDWLAQLQRVFDRIDNLEKPVIGAISGHCLGGGLELALCCDLLVAAETARLGMAEIKIGALPAAGGTQRLPRLIGIPRAKEFIYTGDPIDGNEAHRIGLVNRVVPPDKVMEEARMLASTLCDRPPLTMRVAKKCIDIGMQMPLPAALEWADRCIAAQPPTKDAEEGRLAFREKRKPVFKGE
ncbi:MAG: enoyl-CoA hydratase/isomerase family protein [Chloroflexota bacterium]|nr:enoyl-CoA hydratase/isomerase family protein [Chloroflexota bacterium]